jgi:hypothetical protein
VVAALASCAVVALPLQVDASSPDDGAPITLYSLTGLTTSEQQVLAETLHRLTVECMARRGYDYQTDLYQVGSSPPIGPPSRAELEAFGYAFGQERLAAAGFGDDPPPQDPAMRAALEGDESQPGCGEEVAQLVGLVEFNQARQRISTAAGEIAVAAVAEPDVIAALDSWRACIRDAGYDAANFDEAYELAAASDGGVRGPAGIAIALADYSCRDSSGYTTTRRDTTTRLTREWLDQHPEALSDYLSAEAAFFARLGAAHSSGQ